jgi:hypothetical protein
MDHLLYDELVLGQTDVVIHVAIQDVDLEDDARIAFTQALADLCEGRLAIGAGRGHGRFDGEVVWLEDKSLQKKEAVCP